MESSASQSDFSMQDSSDTFNLVEPTTELKAQPQSQIIANTILKNVKLLKFEVDLELAIIYDCSPEALKNIQSEAALKLVGRRLTLKPKSLLEKFRRLVFGKHMRFLDVEISDGLSNSNPICTINGPVPVPYSFWLYWFFTLGKLGTKFVVKDKDGNIMAFIIQKMKSYHIVDVSGLVILKVKNRQWYGRLYGIKSVFSVHDKTKKQVASIVKLHGGAFQQLLTDFRCYSINFEDTNMDWMLKLMIIACIFKLHFKRRR